MTNRMFQILWEKAFLVAYKETSRVLFLIFRSFLFYFTMSIVTTPGFQLPELFKESIGHAAYEKEIRENLMATDGLRQKTLLYEYQVLTSKIIEAQSKLAILRVDTLATLKAINNKDDDLSPLLFAHFKKRLEMHQSDLNGLTHPSIHTPSSTLPSFSQPSSTEDESESISLGRPQKKHSSRYTKSGPSEWEEDNSSRSVISLRPSSLAKTELYKPLWPETVSCHRQAKRQDRGLNHFIVTSWQWIKFMLIMTLAIMISIKRYKVYPLS